MNVLIKPLLTEKASSINEKGKFTFIVKRGANKVEIKIGIRDEGYVEVISGLNEGDIIVAEGLKKVRPRGKIKPIKN